MKRKHAATIALGTLLALDEGIARQHAHWTGRGYRVSCGRIWFRRDGGWTARLVWKNPKEIVRSVSYSLRGDGPLTP